MSCNIYYENCKVNVEWKHHVLKIFDIGTANLILTLKNQLIFIKRTDNSSNLINLRDNVIDASYSYPLFYIVDNNGHVFKTNIEQISENLWDEIFVEQNIKQICGNGDGVLMISENYELIGMGDFENVLCSVEPKKVDCFSNINALQVAMGDNFALVLVTQQLPNGNNNSIIDKNFMQETREIGRDLLKTQVWSFGSINKGAGDHAKRKDHAVIVKLVDIGVYTISCGSHHAAALTLDGRLFLWGFNNHQQISIDTSIQDLSSPIEFRTEINGKMSKNVLAVTTSSCSTVILFNDLSFKVLGKTGVSQNENEEFASSLKYEHDAGNVEDNFGICNVPYIISHGKVLLINRKNISMFLLTYMNDEQRYNRIMVNAYQKYMIGLKMHDDDSFKLVESFENLLYIALRNLKMIFDLLKSDSEQKLDSAIVNINFTEVIREYHRYLKNLCDIISFYSYDHYEKKIDRKIIKIVLEKPFSMLEIYEKLLDLIYDLHLYNNNPNISIHDHEIEELKRQTVERKKILEDFRKIVVPQKIKEASETFTFWQSLNDSTIKSELHQKERRFVMDSNVVQLKLHDRASLFGKQRFLLFNDYLAYTLSRNEFIPIHLVWMQAFTTQNSNKYSFKIITPENTIKVYTLTSQDKSEWQKNIRECIWRALGIKPTVINQGLPVSRYGSYKFSERNAKYPSYEIEGKWFEGKFYDLCHIRVPSISRHFKCRISVAGEMNGYGMIEDPNFKYHGEFYQGKLHGYGVWKSKISPIFYQGYFKNDKFHGYGVLSVNDVTYYGEFVNNVKNGYGFEDDIISGTKYIGMWQDGKRTGTGILINMDGSYFEGIFANNNLSGDGLAIFPNGSYYIGELNVDGASGNGSFHIPDTEIVEEMMELDDNNLKMRGNVLKGILYGTWDKITISNGTMSMGEIFLKIPNSSNYLKIKPERKWSVFFENWYDEVFGTQNVDKLTTTDLWYRISSFITRKRKFESDMSKNFTLVNEESSKDVDFNEMQYSLPESQQTDNMSLPAISRSNSELYLRDSSSDFDTASLKTLSDYSISSIAAASKKHLINDHFDFVPSFYNSNFSTHESIEELKNYLNESICDIHHPFHLLINTLRQGFCACYGSWRSKPTSIISKIAITEWISLMKRIYNIFRLLFPGLPTCDDSINNNSDDESSNDECKLLSPLNFMHQILLDEEIYSCFFLLYASKNSRQDELYAQRLLTCEKKTNEELRQLLKIEPNLIQLLEDEEFYRAIEHFKKLSHQYCPSKMLQIIKDTFEMISNCANKLSEKKDLLSADNLLSITIYLIVKASINHLGAELSLLTDLMENDIEKLINMEQYIYTTVKIGYLHSLSSKFFHN
ncbi:hypothetical protein PVAND_015763 [Polypedilum vanderplanki]|uniref:VPS9 domain-containing protein n=1 Tax=Polypedilum vanderplanki TaxID=319348 RepID=A0A9J6BDK8_POLVA|nr:hypothetical protein PVAND_015763 [Polypedilum vanderplanki]